MNSVNLFHSCLCLLSKLETLDILIQHPHSILEYKQLLKYSKYNKQSKTKRRKKKHDSAKAELN